MTDVILNTEEQQLVASVARQRNLSFDQAVQQIFKAGVEGVLSDITPTTMFLISARKRQNQNGNKSAKCHSQPLNDSSLKPGK